MKKSDIDALRHPSATEPQPCDLDEDSSYVVVVSLTDAVENVRIAQERFMKMQLEHLRP
jgi:hypothetical protein